MTTALKLPDYDRLSAPASAEQAARRAAERRARMSRAGLVAAMVEKRERAVRASAAVPGFARRLIACGAAVEADTVLVHYGVFRDLPLGVLWRPMSREHGEARAEAIYWIFGLTDETAERVAARFGLDAPSLALQAMRAHARSNGLPTIDVDDMDGGGEGVTGARGIDRMRRQGPRFSVVPPAAAFDARLEALDVRVLLVFGLHIDRQGWCFRSQVKMARELGVGRATLQRAIARLVGAGYLEQRAMPTRDGSQGVHEYRVFFDPQGEDEADLDDAPESDAPDGEAAPEAPARQRAPLPASGQGPARAMERAAYNDPFLTNLRERRASEDLEVPDPEWLAAFRRAWPRTAIDDPVAVEAAWRALSTEDRKAALDGVPVFLAALKAQRQTHVPGGANYLAKRRWESAVAAASTSPAAPVGESAFAQVWSKPFWACALWSATNGVPRVEMRQRRARAETKVGWPIKGEAMRGGVAALVETLRQFPSDGAHARDWGAWLAAGGFDISDKLAAGARFWVFLPEHPPPRQARAESEDELADAMGKT